MTDHLHPIDGLTVSRVKNTDGRAGMFVNVDKWDDYLGGQDHYDKLIDSLGGAPEGTVVETVEDGV